MNTTKEKIQTYLIGSWRIENPNLQSFIQFNQNGKANYYFNRHSFEKDTLSESGRWEIDIGNNQSLTDTFQIRIFLKNKITFHAVIQDSLRFMTLEKGHTTRFTRLK